MSRLQRSDVVPKGRRESVGGKLSYHEYHTNLGLCPKGAKRELTGPKEIQIPDRSFITGARNFRPGSLVIIYVFRRSVSCVRVFSVRRVCLHTVTGSDVRCQVSQVVRVQHKSGMGLLW